MLLHFCILSIEPGKDGAVFVFCVTELLLWLPSLLCWMSLARSFSRAAIHRLNPSGIARWMSAAVGLWELVAELNDIAVSKLPLGDAPREIFK